MATWPMSGAQSDQIAPRLSVARQAISAVSVLGRIATTRSPCPTPIFRICAATLATCARSSAQVISRRPKVSDCTISATRSGVISPWRRICSAKFSRAPGNHTAPGIRRSASATSGTGAMRRSKKARMAVQNPSRSRTLHSQSAL